MIVLEKLKWSPKWVSHLGCIKGCLEYLGSDLSFSWLYGGTGYAFIISLDPGVDVSSPDSWNHEPQYRLGRNLGYVVDGGAIIISTESTLPKKMKTQIYDITDLVGTPSGAGFMPMGMPFGFGAMPFGTMLPMGLGGLFGGMMPYGNTGYSGSTGYTGQRQTPYRNIISR